LSQDTGPVDRVDGTEMMLVVEFTVPKEVFDDILTVIKGTFNAEVVDVLVQYCGHLSFLDRTDTTVGVENEDRDVLLVTKTIDSGTYSSQRRKEVR
jgi:hypothetical protein